jgi:glutathionyl-hydroquinone reductase
MSVQALSRRPEAHTPAANDDPHEPTTFRHWVRNEPGARFAPAAGRYHLYVMYGCPWAQRTLIVRALKGLERAIGYTATHHHHVPEEGWIFAAERPDPLYGAKRLRELYLRADPGFAGRVTVPVLWDKHEQTIVNNESAEIMRMLNEAFDAFAEHPQVDLYPQALRAEIDRWNERIYHGLNVAGYRAGFATTQAAYDAAVCDVFGTLDALEAHLGSHRYVAGPQPTEADWRLLPTLLRFDIVYHGLFKLNLRRLIDYPLLCAYVRDLMQYPGVAATFNRQHIVDGYWGSMKHANPGGIIPAGPLVDCLTPAQSADVCAVRCA